MLSHCQKCIDLTIDIAYDGDVSEYEEETESSDYEDDVERHFNEEILPRLTWMKSLRSLVLLKYGPSFNWAANCVRSRLLDHLLQRVFGNDPHLPISLTRLWILCFHFPPTLVDQTIIPSLTAYYYRDDEAVGEPQNYDEFRDVEHIGFVRFGSLTQLPNLKSVYGYFTEHSDPHEMIEFIRTHPNLEHLTIIYSCLTFPEDPEELPLYVPNPEFQLLKLKSLYFVKNFTNKEMVKEFVKVYPNLERIHLESNLQVNSSNDEKVRVDEESLKAIHFQHLTSLCLLGFHLDGSSLLPIITNCPKLEVLHLNYNAIQTNSSFFLNLKLFMESAEKLREISLECDHQHTDIEEVLSIFDSILPSASHLERMFITWKAFPVVSLDHPLTESIINFAQKMERLVALCLVFHRLRNDNARDHHSCCSCCDDDYHYGVDDNDDVDVDANGPLMEQINQRMAEEVISTRPALWFHLGSELPDATDVPLVHYQELINVDPWNPPIEF